MDDIPQDVLYEAYSDGQMATTWDFLRLVAQHHADRAERLRSLRKKSWQSNSRELDGVADHIRAYADQLETFALNNPPGVSLVADDDNREDPRDTVNGETDQPQRHTCEYVTVTNLTSGLVGQVCNMPGLHGGSEAEQAADQPVMPPAKGRRRKEAPQLPGNTGRCASFRRANPDDQTVCELERGHEGQHATRTENPLGFVAWPRTPSGAVCGDVVILPDGTALNCARPLGHDGDEHHDGRYRFWPRGVGTSRQTSICERCNLDTHACPGCGEPIGHYADDCGHDCTAPAVGFDGADVTLPPLHPPMPEPPLAAGDEIFPNQCSSRRDGERCMLPGAPMHTGKHKGTKGGAWAQEAAEPAATLGDIAEQQRATMVIPEQRETVENVEREMRAELAVIAAAKEEVSATVADLTGDEPIGTTVNVGGIEFVKHSNNPFPPTVNDGSPLGNALSNPFQVRELGIVSNPLPQLAFTPENGYSVTPLGNPFQAPPPPPAAFLPPHMVPGAPKAHQSHSSITTMEKCGLQYRLKYRDGIGDDTPAWWNVAGTAFHTVVQAIEAAHADGTPMWAPDAELMPQEREAAATWKAMFATLVERTERESGKARSTWKAAKGGKEGEAFWREYGGDLARMYVAHRRRFLAEPEGWRLLSKPGGEGWAHEVEFNATVDGVLLKGFIDAAWISADGTTILIEDFKSGSSEGDPFQPKLYGAALRALGFIDGRRVITRFYEARKGAHSATVELTSADDTEVSYRANTAQTMDRAGIFPPNPSGYNCSTCPVKSRCPIMASKS